MMMTMHDLCLQLCFCIDGPGRTKHDITFCLFFLSVLWSNPSVGAFRNDHSFFLTSMCRPRNNWFIWRVRVPEGSIWRSNRRKTSISVRNYRCQSARRSIECAQVSSGLTLKVFFNVNVRRIERVKRQLPSTARACSREKRWFIFNIFCLERQAHGLFSDRKKRSVCSVSDLFYLYKMVFCWKRIDKQQKRSQIEIEKEFNIYIFIIIASTRCQMWWHHPKKICRCSSRNCHLISHIDILSRRKERGIEWVIVDQHLQIQLKRRCLTTETPATQSVAWITVSTESTISAVSTVSAESTISTIAAISTESTITETEATAKSTTKTLLDPSIVYLQWRSEEEAFSDGGEESHEHSNED